MLRQAALPKQLPGKGDQQARVELALSVERDENELKQASGRKPGLAVCGTREKPIGTKWKTR